MGQNANTESIQRAGPELADMAGFLRKPKHHRWKNLLGLQLEKNTSQILIAAAGIWSGTRVQLVITRMQRRGNSSGPSEQRCWRGRERPLGFSHREHLSSALFIDLSPRIAHAPVLRSRASANRSRETGTCRTRSRATPESSPTFDAPLSPPRSTPAPRTSFRCPFHPAKAAHHIGGGVELAALFTKPSSIHGLSTPTPAPRPTFTGL
ncbi:hypothetical protein BDK51DRAFT_48167 [Blyttiomyces helicus]|uniref:Uncharacterized protein n=1 Tax=Blyttiomyces helicus TaxID=388810 RepID=A0A4P9WJC2_9FUNG|nr:hypothetical protein BDK51DRAFT_48167 [Blyttiomyces helicus]|eukprot:RKO92462.1 hypothetical protein BDK51DRAFT_48167 [Blyttiomyces helicus]